MQIKNSESILEQTNFDDFKSQLEGSQFLVMVVSKKDGIWETKQFLS